MKYQIRNVLFGTRLAVALFFIVFSLTLPWDQKASILVLSAVYISLSIYAFLFSTPNKPLNKFLDIPFILSAVFVGNNPLLIYSVIPYIVLFTPRYYPSSLIMVIVGFIASAFVHGTSFLNIILDMIIITATFIASTSPDFLEHVKKELRSINILKRTLNNLSKEYAEWEVTDRKLKATEALLDLSVKHPNLRGFLKDVIETFDIVSVSIVPTSSRENLIVKKNEEEKTYTVPVALEKGNALVVFTLKHKYQLMDKSLLSTLERVANMINIYIEGFPEDAVYKNIKINVDAG